MQKSAEKQSVRLDDLVADFNPTTGHHLAVPWKNFQSFRHFLREGGVDSQFNASLSSYIQSWVDILESGGSVGAMSVGYLLFINRRKWAALGVVYQDAASDNMTDEAALLALEFWGTWDRGVLELEYLDWSRNKRILEVAEKAGSKKLRVDSVANGGGRVKPGRLGGRGKGGGGRGRSLSTVPGRGVAQQAPQQSAQNQASSQNQRSKSICLDNIGELMGMPNVACGRGNTCMFTHVLSLQELERVNVDRDIRGILRNSPKLQPFLNAIVNVKFKGE